MPDLGIFADKLAGNLRRIILRAEQEAQRQGHTLLVPEQVIATIAELEPALFNEVAMQFGHDPQQRLKEIRAKIGTHQNRRKQTGLSEEMRWLLHYSLIDAHQHDRRLIEPEDFLRVYFARKQSMGKKLRNLFGGRNS
jgi:ATP-dependent Clp protease ATP-binding subunit ClpA